MDIKQKTLIPVILALAVTAGLLTVLSVASQNVLIENQEQEKLLQLGGSLADKIKARGEMSAALATSIAANPEVQRAFAMRERQTLLTMLLPTYQELAKSYGATQGQFHLAPTSASICRKPAARSSLSRRQARARTAPPSPCTPPPWTSR